MAIGSYSLQVDEERAKNQLIAEKEDIASILERRDQEIQRLTGIVKELLFTKVECTVGLYKM